MILAAKSYMLNHTRPHTLSPKAASSEAKTSTCSCKERNNLGPIKNCSKHSPRSLSQVSQVSRLSGGGQEGFGEFFRGLRATLRGPMCLDVCGCRSLSRAVRLTSEMLHRLFNLLPRDRTGRGKSYSEKQPSRWLPCCCQ